MADEVMTVVDRLDNKYSNATYDLNWETPLQLLVGSIMAACTLDTLVNKLTPALFKKYPDAQAFADADHETLVDDIRKVFSPGRKAEAIREACRVLVEKHGGEVPRTMDELVTLPRVGRKTANVVLSVAYKIPAGILIDTHGQRVITRLGLAKGNTPEKIELELMERVPQDRWIHFGPALVLHGRYTCTAASPKCPDCILQDVCPKIGTAYEKSAAKSTKTVAPARKGKKGGGSRGKK